MAWACSARPSFNATRRHGRGSLRIEGVYSSFAKTLLASRGEDLAAGRFRLGDGFKSRALARWTIDFRGNLVWLAPFHRIILLHREKSHRQLGDAMLAVQRPVSQKRYFEPADWKCRHSESAGHAARRSISAAPRLAFHLS
jgi:hypothetical protein